MDKPKRKGYGYNKSYINKKSKQYSLETGMTGFLCTCNFREKECVRDAYKILEQFANELYPTDDKTWRNSNANDNMKTSLCEEVKGKENDDDKDDISDALNKEIESLKAEANRPAVAKRFQCVDAGVKNVIFMRTALPDPLELVLHILKKVDETKERITRFVLRLLPVQFVCKANISEIKSKADQLFEKYFAQEPKTFSIVFNRHCNDKISRNEIIKELAALVSMKNPDNKADLTNPEIAVVVEIIRGFCLLSIAPDYHKYKKYNLFELCNVKEMEKPSEAVDVSPGSGGNEKSEDRNEPTKQMADSEKSEMAEKNEGNLSEPQE